MAKAIKVTEFDQTGENSFSARGTCDDKPPLSNARRPRTVLRARVDALGVHEAWRTEFQKKLKPSAAIAPLVSRAPYKPSK